MLTDKIVESFINRLYAERKSPSTITNYRYNLELFVKFTGVSKFTAIERQHIVNFLAHRAEGTSPATSHQAFRVLRTFFRWCMDEGLLEQYPMKNIDAPKLEYKVIEIFTQDDINRLLAACQPKTFIGERNRAIIYCLLDSGVRAEELVSLSVNSVDYRSGIVKIKGKGGKERLTKFGNNARQYLWKYMLIRDIKAPREQLSLFLSEEMKPLTRNGLTTIISKLGKKVGRISTRCSPHTFRHTWAIQFLMNGGNISDLQVLGGWADLDSIKPYLLRVKQHDALQSHEKFSPGDRML